jgi:hypothetical protein
MEVAQLSFAANAADEKGGMLSTAEGGWLVLSIPDTDMRTVIIRPTHGKTVVTPMYNPSSDAERLVFRFLNSSGVVVPSPFIAVYQRMVTEETRAGTPFSRKTHT